MDERIPELLGIIRDEIRFYRDLLDCERQKTVLLACGHVEELMRCNQTETESVDRLRALEATRLGLCRQLSEDLRIPGEEFTLTRLAERIAERGDRGNDTRALGEASALLGDLLTQLQVVGARNRCLIDKSLRYAEGMLTIFANATGSYHPDGMFATADYVRPTFSRRA